MSTAILSFPTTTTSATTANTAITATTTTATSSEKMGQKYISKVVRAETQTQSKTQAVSPPKAHHDDDNHDDKQHEQYEQHVQHKQYVQVDGAREAREAIELENNDNGSNDSSVSMMMDTSTHSARKLIQQATDSIDNNNCHNNDISQKNSNVDDTNNMNSHIPKMDIEQVTVKGDCHYKDKNDNMNYHNHHDNKNSDTVISNNAHMTDIVIYNPQSTPSLLLSTLPTTTKTTTTQNTQSSYAKVSEHAGLNNLGNTCYLNSALQMLFSIDSFVHQMIHFYHCDNTFFNHDQDDHQKHTSCNNKNNNQHDNHNDNKIKSWTQEKQKYFPLHIALANLFHSMNNHDDINNNSYHNNNNHDDNNNCNNGMNDNRNNTDNTNNISNVSNSNSDSDFQIHNPILNNDHIMTKTAATTVSTSTVSTNNHHDEYIRQLKNVIDKLTPLFLGYSQQDSHEFLSTIIDLLHDEVLNYETEKKKEGQEQQELQGQKEVYQEQQKVLQEQQEQYKQCERCEQHEVKDMSYHLQIGSEDETVCEEMDITECTTTTHHENPTTTITSDKHSRDILQNNHIGYVMVHNYPHVGVKNNNDIDDSLDQNPEYSNKKLRFTKVGLDNTNCEKNKVDDTHNDTKSNKYLNDNNMTKVPSFSQLKLEDISVLLHGTKDENNNYCNIGEHYPIKYETRNVQQQQQQQQQQHPIQKLVGGRMAKQHEFNNTSSAIFCPLKNAENNDDLNEDLDNNVQQEINSTLIESSSSSPPPAVSIQHTDHSIFPSIVDTFFTMEIRTCLVCISCNFKRSRQETFRHLSIDIGNADYDEEQKSNTQNSTDTSLSLLSTISSFESHYERTVQEGIRKFFASEKLELKCEKCFGESATQTKEITRLPKVLLLHLKRFVVDYSPDYSYATYRKNRAAVEFNESLSLDVNDDQSGVLAQFLATDVTYANDNIELLDRVNTHCDDKSEVRTEDDDFEMIENEDNEVEEDEDFVDLGAMRHKYKVRSVVNHIGSSAACGHYTANALKLGKQQTPNKREWFKFNDDFVSRMCKEEALGEAVQKSAYMILYELE